MPPTNAPKKKSPADARARRWLRRLLASPERAASAPRAAAKEK
jgi:hypothetical protein